MLFLTFELGSDRYVIDTAEVVEVLACLPLKSVPSAPAWVAGLFTYRGDAVPVIDLCALALGRPASDHISTRLIVVRYEPRRTADTGTVGTAPATHLLGLIAEHANRTLRRDAAEFAESGIDTPDARWLGRVAHDPEGMLQWVRVDELLPDDVRARLFTAECA